MLDPKELNDSFVEWTKSITELTAIPGLLRILELNNCIVTIDVMGCQREIARTIIGREADYILA